MCKIALIIFPIHASHGCILQTYALKSKIEELGYEVTLINRHWNAPSVFTRFKYSVKMLLNRIIYGVNIPLVWQDPCNSFKLEELHSLINEYLYPNIVDIKKESELSRVDWNNYYALIVGSDQTWRPKYVSNVFNYYLNFAETYSKPLKISYAASFGTDCWEYDALQTEIAKSLLSKFDAVSVRESSAISLCKRYLNRESINVVDPTLLLSGDEYINKLKLSKVSRNIVATYFLDKSVEKDRLAKKIAINFKLELVEVNRDMENPLAPYKSQVAPSMKEWLETSLSAKYVIVDSFHAMVFAILFHKQFVVVGNIERGLSRFQSILDAIGLTDRLYKEDEDIIEQITKSIDWFCVENALSKLRKKSTDFLINALKNEK